ncbi:MAG: DMT family transporter [Schwartzia sp.]|nr:DMT family transporter [Schwartzia sp. (in: firmicutes)]
MQLRGSLCLLGAAFLWGTTFVAQSVGMDRLGPFTYMSARFFLGGLALFLLYLIVRRKILSWNFWKHERGRVSKISPLSDGGRKADGWKAGAGAGLIMFFAAALQQYGIQYTTASKAAFLTCMYLVIVPIGGVLLRQRIKVPHIIGGVFALAGLYLLCITDGLSLAYGDAIVFIGSFFWTAHILFTDRFASDVDVIEMSLAQVIVVFVLSTVAALAFEVWVWADVFGAWVAIAFGGILSTCVAFTLQIVGQRYADPAPAAIIMSLESVFGTLAGWLILGETMSAREAWGCSLMMTGMLTSQLGGLSRKKK